MLYKYIRITNGKKIMFGRLVNTLTRLVFGYSTGKHDGAEFMSIINRVKKSEEAPISWAGNDLKIFGMTIFRNGEKK